MAETLSTDQLSDIRADVGDTGTAPAFSDDELQRLYARAVEDGGAYDTTVYYAVRQLRANATKLADYTAGETSESRSQVARQLEKLEDDWAGRSAAEIARLEKEAGNARQLVTGRLKRPGYPRMPG